MTLRIETSTNAANLGEGFIFDNIVFRGFSLGLPEDLTGNGFVDFEDLTVLLANWNQDVDAARGNLVDPDGSPVNFEDLTVLLAAWTGPGGAASPQAAVGAAVGGDFGGDSGGDGPLVAVGEASYRRRDDAPRQAAAYGLRRLQAAAVDRALGEQSESTLVRRTSALVRRRR